MKKKFTFLIAAIALLSFLAVPLGMRGQTRTEVTDLINNQATSSNLSNTATSSWAAEFDLTGTSGAVYYIRSMGTKNTSNALQWNTNGYLYTTTTGGTLKSVTVNGTNNKSIKIYAANSAYSEKPTGTQLTTLNLTGSDATYTFTDDYTYLGLVGGTSGIAIISISIVWEDGSGGSDTYTVTYNANGATSGSVPADSNSPYASGATVTVLGNTGNLAKTGYDWSSWCLNAEGTGTTYTAGNTFTINANTMLYAKWTAHTHDVTMPDDDEYGSYIASEDTDVPYGTTVTLTYEPNSGYENYDATWTVNGTAISGNTFSMPDEDVTVGVTLTNYLKDQVDIDFAGVSSGGYTAWSGKTGTSGAIYAGKTAGSLTVTPKYIQLTNNSSSGNSQYSGIITTGSGGKIKKVVVTWATKYSNTNGRYLTIYGKNTSYEASSDLYDSSKRGTELGSITYSSSSSSTTASLTISGDYKFVGLLTNGAMYFDKIDIYWEPSTEPSITASDVNIAYNATSGNIACTINHEPTPAGTLTAAIVEGGNIANLTLGTIANNTVPFSCSANTTASVHTATVRLTYTYGDSQTATKDVIITQASNPDAVYTISEINTENTNYTIRGTVVALTARAVVVGDGTGYIYFYNGYSAPSNVAVNDMVTVSGNMTSYGHIYQFSSQNNNGGTITTASTSNYDGTPEVTVITEIPTSTYSTGLHLSDYFQFEGTLTKSSGYYYVGVGEGQINIAYPSSDQQSAMNALENKTVRVKGYFAGINSSNYFSVALESIEEVVITEPYITIESDEFELTAAAETGELDIEYGNFTLTSFDIQFYDNENNELNEGPDWLTLAIEEDGGNYSVSYATVVNEGTARTAYFKVYDGEVYSNLVTITQAAPVVDNASLPFIWEGGTSGDLGNENGVTVYSDSDYAAQNAPYRVKFTNTGHYILVKTNEQPAVVSVEIKKLGGNNNSKITIQASSDGTDFRNVQEFSNEGAQNVILTHITTNSFAATDRYIRIYFTKVSENGTNIGVGPITIRGIETYTHAVNGYTTNTNGWNLIASPVATTPSEVTNMTSNDYDLYRFNQSAGNGLVWENYENSAHQSGFTITPGQGYLYANSGTVTLSFTGTPYVGDGVITMLNAGWNLVGNPYYNTTTNIGRDYYRMNSTNDGLIPASGSENVNAWEGIFVVAAQANETVTFTKVNPEGNAGSGNNNSTVVMSLTQNRSGVVDRAIVRFDERENLPKFQLFETSTKLSLVQDNEEYAIVSTEAHGEMPVSFKANQNGQYTITVNTENVEMGYLHLVDNMTGADIDLLNTPSYTFNARVDDYTSRFKLVFSANGMNNENGNDDFAFLSNGQLIIANDGEATLQVVDITGRILSSEVINGSCSKNIDAATGVYVLRLVNGSNVKTQKVIIK